MAAAPRLWRGRLARALPTLRYQPADRAHLVLRRAAHLAALAEVETNVAGAPDAGSASAGLRVNHHRGLRDARAASADARMATAALVETLDDARRILEEVIDAV